MKKFYPEINKEQLQALTAAITSEVIVEFDMDRDISSRLYGTIETAILDEFQKEVLNEITETKT